jgi:hypothetical protein
LISLSRFYEFKEFAYKTALTEGDRSALRQLERPVIEFNITNAPISRLAGEWSKQEPTLYVSKDDNSNVPQELVDVIEGHVRHIIADAQKRGVLYEMYRDTLTGGFSALELRIDYKNDRSFEQEIYLDLTFDPTLVGFSPTAKTPTKDDSDFYFTLVPLTLKQFKKEFPGIDTKSMMFTKKTDSMNWSYTSASRTKMVIVCYFYEWKEKPITLVELSDGRTMTMPEYEKEKATFELEDNIAVFPAIVDTRKSKEKYICRYTIVENEVIDYKETIFETNNLIFVDGDSIRLRETSNGDFKQFTKPYIYHAKGLQRLVNVAGQTIANDFENMSMHKIMVAQEALPDVEGFRDAYVNPQVAPTLVYKSRDDESGEALPPRS